jgi:hypothetical protein
MKVNSLDKDVNEKEEIVTNHILSFKNFNNCNFLMTENYFYLFFIVR